MKDLLTFDTKKANEFFLKKISFCVGPFELKNYIDDKIDELNIIDVRKYEDYIEGHIPFAIHIPFESFDEHLVMLEKDKINIIYCYSEYCKLADKACYMASKKNYPVQVLNGGFEGWKKQGFEVINTSKQPE